PEAEKNAAIAQDAGLEVRARGERDLLDAAAIAVHDKERFGALFVILLQVTGPVGAEDDPAIGQIGAAEIVEGAVRELPETGAVHIHFVHVEPIFAVAAHSEEHLLTIERGLRSENGAGLEVRQPRQL